MFKLSKWVRRSGFGVFATLALAVVSVFTPGSALAAATAPSLGAAASYSVLAGSIVTNGGPTTMPGNLGISPGIGVTPHYTGFPPGTLSGTIHDADTSAGLAQAADTAAFGVLDQTPTVTYGTKDLVGLFLVPGVYAADAFTLSGTLTLVGSGVWIFKSASTLITSGTANVVGGDPCSVWWRVGSSATLGTNTQLTGNILALTAITLASGAALDGQALAQTGAVNLADNQITQTPCGGAPGALSLTKTVSLTTFSFVGDILNYTLVATNDGNVTDANVTISDPGLTITGSTPAQGSSLAPGATMTVTGTYTITAANIGVGSFTNTATASATGVTASAPASAIAVENGTLQILKYEDDNQNGIRDPAEPVLPGWHFQIIGPNGYSSSGVSDASGLVTLPNLVEHCTRQRLVCHHRQPPDGCRKSRADDRGAVR
jgi:uncharacterized repeat protein (TIGR01451 family)